MNRKYFFIFLIVLYFPALGKNKTQTVEDSIRTAFGYIGTNPKEALRIAQHILNTGKKNQNIKVQISSGRIIGQVYINWGEFHSADSVLKWAIYLGESNFLRIATADTKVNYGNFKLQKGDYQGALKEYTDAKSVFEKEKNQRGLIKCITNIGLCHMYFSDYELASNHLHEALQIAEKNNEILFQGLINNNLARLQMRSSDYKKAKYYAEKSIILFLKVGNYRSAARSQTILANAYFNSGEYDNSLNEINLALDATTEFEDHQNIINAYILLGKLNALEGKTDTSEKYFNEAMKIGADFELRKDLNNAQINYGLFLVKEDKFKTAEKVLTDAMSLSLLIKNKENSFKAYIILEELYEKNNQIEKAYMALKKIDNYKDSLNYSAYRIEILESENETQRANALLRYREMTIYWLILSLLVIMVIVILIIYNIKTKRKSERLQYDKNEALLREKNTEIRKNKEIEAVIAEIKGQESERKRLAKDLHDGLGGTLASIKLNLEMVHNILDTNQELDNVIHKLDNACKEVRTISHHLIPPEFNEKDFSEILENYLEEIAQNSNTKTYLDLYPEAEFNQLNTILKNDIYRIIQELTNNTIKHAYANKLDIQLIMHLEYISLIAEDNGLGFNTDDYKPGIGLNNIKSRLEPYNGEILIDSKKGRGTVTDIKIPI